MYLTLYSEFLLFDFEGPAALYALDHFCMMALFALLAHAAASPARKRRKGAAKP